MSSCFCLMHRPFSVHAQLRHAVRHHSVFFLQQPFTASLFFSPAAISSCIPQTTMCFSATFLILLSLLPFRLCFLFNHATLGLWPCPRFCLHSGHNLFFIVPFRSQLLCTAPLTSFFNDVFDRILSAVNGTDAPTLLSVSFDMRPIAHSTCCR